MLSISHILPAQKGIRASRLALNTHFRGASRLSNADLAMYRAKAGDGGRALTYDPQMRVALLARLDLQAELRGALGRDELVLRY